MKSYVITGLLGVTALIMASLALWHAGFESPSSSGVRLERVDTARLLKGGNVIGSTDAEFHIVEFSNFMCPFCKEVQPVLDDILKMSDGRIAIIYRHLVSEAVQPDAFMAALAAECAAAQDSFESMHQVLFENQRELGEISWTLLGQMAGISNANAFEECLNQELFRDKIEDDIAAARKIGVNGTPTFILNEWSYGGARSVQQLQQSALSLLQDDG